MAEMSHPSPFPPLFSFMKRISSHWRVGRNVRMTLRGADMAEIEDFFENPGKEICRYKLLLSAFSPISGIRLGASAKN
jgi:hypothetical protein